MTTPAGQPAGAATPAAPAGCPEWCTGGAYCQDYRPEDRYHLSDGETVRLPHDHAPTAELAFVIAYTSARGLARAGVTLAVRRGDGSRSWSTGPIGRQAGEAFALLAELLADVTPEVHHQVAALVRRNLAAAAPAGKETTDET